MVRIQRYLGGGAVVKGGDTVRFVTSQVSSPVQMPSPHTLSHVLSRMKHDPVWAVGKKDRNVETKEDRKG